MEKAADLGSLGLVSYLAAARQLRDAYEGRFQWFLTYYTAVREANT